MRRSVAGFTLLEAIVALAILSAGAMALFAAVNGALRSLDRAEQASRLDTAVENAMDRLELVNPMVEPQGDTVVGAYELHWQAEAIAPPREGLTDYLRPGLYDLALYDVHAELRRDGRVERRFVLRRVGFLQARAREIF